MGTPFPVEVGSRGTIASLVSQEIAYYNFLELTKENKSNNKKKNNKVDVSCKFLPSICKTLDIAGNIHIQRMVRIGYKKSHLQGGKEALQV